MASRAGNSASRGLFENVEMTMLLEKPIEQPWAFATRKGFNGEAPGNYFMYFRTREEAEHRRAHHERRWPERYRGPIEHRPGESWD